MGLKNENICISIITECLKCHSLWTKCLKYRTVWTECLKYGSLRTRCLFTYKTRRQHPLVLHTSSQTEVLFNNSVDSGFYFQGILTHNSIQLFQLCPKNYWTIVMNWNFLNSISLQPDVVWVCCECSVSFQ